MELVGGLGQSEFQLSSKLSRRERCICIAPAPPGLSFVFLGHGQQLFYLLIRCTVHSARRASCQALAVPMDILPAYRWPQPLLLLSTSSILQMTNIPMKPFAAL